MSRRLAVGIVTGAAAFTVAACQSAAAPTDANGSTTSAPVAQATAVKGDTTNVPQWKSPPAMTVDPNKTYTATINTSEGALTADLYVKDAPITVNNFVFLANQHFYENVKFHRIIKTFMSQTGDPTGTGAGGPGYRFNDEPVTRKYLRGTLAMANAGPNTNGSQFFLMNQDYPLPPNYTIFGQVTGGLDVLDKIANTPVVAGPSGEQSMPTKDVTIQTITIQEK